MPQFSAPARAAGPSGIAVVHYHFRPGGVRRVIELGLPAIAAGAPHGVGRVLLFSGEDPDPTWVRGLRKAMRPARVDVVVEAAARYFSETRVSAGSALRRISGALDRALGDGVAAIWAHNLGLARNVRLAAAVRRVAGARSIPVVSHHHDLWCDNRWNRWPEIEACGFADETALAAELFPSGPGFCHAAINRLDYSSFEAALGRRAAWIPNLVAPPAPPRRVEVARARRWLDGIAGAGRPVWTVPTRFLRRKNLAEAVLLARWLRPEAMLVTTAGVSSRDEAEYARTLRDAASVGRWPVRFCAVAEAGADAPPIGAVVAASEALVLPSLQEGFGLPYLESASAGKPLVARRLPNVVPDLEGFGFRFPHLYDEAWIAPGLLDVRAERARQREAWTRWRARVPAHLRRFASPAAAVGARGAIAFSRLTLAGQLEVLGHSPEVSWAACAALNPGLATIQKAAADGKLRATPWTRRAADRVGAAPFAKRFWSAARAARGGEHVESSAAASTSLQRSLIRQRMSPEFLYPLLFP